MADILEMAKDLGRTLARTEEYQTLRRAISLADGDRDIVELTSRLEALEGRVHAALQEGKRPPKEVQEEYDSVMGRLEASAAYQRLVSAQANFDKIVQRVNLTIQKGLEEAAESRIILPS